MHLTTVVRLALLLPFTAACRDSFAPAGGIPVVGGPRFRATLVGYPVDSATSSVEGGVARCERDGTNDSVWCVLTDTLSRPELGLDHDRTVVLASRRFPIAPGRYVIDTVIGREATKAHASDFMGLTWALSSKDRTTYIANRGTVTVLSVSDTRVTGVFDVAFVEGYVKGDPTPAQRMHVSGSFEAPVVPRPGSTRHRPPPEPFY